MRPLIRLLFIVMAMLTAAACGRSPEPKDDQADKLPRPVRLAVVEASTGGSVEAIMGSVVARNRADIQAKVQARIERITVGMGSYVKKGEPLAELDTREFRARVQQARAMYEQTSSELGRYESMLARRMISQQDYDAAKARASVAEAGLHEAEALLSYGRIEAPFSGRVTQKLVDIGDLAVPGRPLFTLEEEAAPRFVVSISESRGGQLAVGDKVRVEIPSIDTIILGRVEELSPSAEQATRTFRTRIILDPCVRVRPGQFGRLLLSVGSEESLLIPDRALVRRGQLELVYVASSDSSARLRLVRTGRRFPTTYEILAGLSAGEKVVVSDPATLSDGDRIEERP
jgi:RND family efflux transporter MFP subunit